MNLDKRRLRLIAWAACSLLITQIGWARDAKFVLLPATRPAAGLFVSDEWSASSPFAQQVVATVQRYFPSLPIHILINDSSPKARARWLKTTSHPRSLHFIAVSGSSEWPQDFMALGADSLNRPALLRLPYDEHDEFADRSSSLSAEVAHACKLPSMQPVVAPREGANNLGGNLMAFPGGVIAVGSGVSPQLEKFLIRDAIPAPVERLIEIKTDWLPAGHVDELFSVVPGPNDERCGFSILYASPDNALKIAIENSRHNPAAPDLLLAQTDQVVGPWHPANCLSALGARGTIHFKEAAACAAFLNANHYYDHLIQSELDRLVNRVEQATGCGSIQRVPLPVLYLPSVSPSSAAPSFVGAPVAVLNPNPVNGLVLKNLFVTGKQPNPLFESAIRSQLHQRGMAAEFVDSSVLHAQNGGVHCATNVIRQP